MDEEDEDEDEDEEDEDEEADEGAVEEFNEDDGMEVEPNLNTDTTDSETVADEQLIERFSHVWPHTAELLSIGRVDDDAEVLEGIRPRTARGIVFTSIIKPEVRNFDSGFIDYLVQSTDSWYRLRIEKDKLFTTTLLEAIPLLPNGEVVKSLAVRFDPSFDELAILATLL